MDIGNLGAQFRVDLKIAQYAKQTRQFIHTAECCDHWIGLADSTTGAEGCGAVITGLRCNAIDSGHELSGSKISVHGITNASEIQPGERKTMPSFDVVSEVEFFLKKKVGELRRSGISDDRILIDPGFGFGKTSQHNLALIKEISRLGIICPLLIGLSRKRIISELCKRKSEPADRLGGSLAMALWSAMQGASVVRVHDVKETKEMIAVYKALGGDNIFSGVGNERQT